jgi:hypothetical protein
VRRRAWSRETHETGICRGRNRRDAASRSIEWQDRDAAQQNLHPNLPHGREGRIPVESPLQLCETQGRQQHFAVMFRQFVENGIRAVTGVDGDVGVD